MIEAVLLDLDDTLYEQRLWLAGAWRAVAAAAAPWGVPPEGLTAALDDIAAQGSGAGRIIDRALARVGAEGVPLEPLVEAFRTFRSTPLAAYPGAAQGVADLRRQVGVALVTDGDVATQADKLRALGLEASFDAVVFSDALGRDRRKPHPAPFQAALRILGVGPEAAVHVGDNPTKDIAGAAAAGIRPVRVLTGEHRLVADEVAPWAVVADIEAAVALVLGRREEASIGSCEEFAL